MFIVCLIVSFTASSATDGQVLWPIRQLVALGHICLILTMLNYHCVSECVNLSDRCQIVFVICYSYSSLAHSFFIYYNIVQTYKWECWLIATFYIFLDVVYIRAQLTLSNHQCELKKNFTHVFRL